MKLSTFYFLFFTFFNLAVSAQQSKLLDIFLNDEAVKNAAVSICFADASTGEILLMNQPHAAVVPASVLKLVTSATALKILGSDYKFMTNIGITGKIESRTLKGDLVIKGGGDPTLGSKHFSDNTKEFLQNWAHSIKLAGIDTIMGNIVADPSVYSDQDVVQSWLWEDIGSYYGAAAQGISVFDNSFDIVFETSDTIGVLSRIKSIDPQIPGLIVNNQVVSGSDNKDRTYIFGSPYENTRLIKGTLPKGKKEYLLSASVPDPSILLASELTKVLRDSLVVIGGICESRKIETDSILFKWQSPELSEIIKLLNFESVNLIAEHLLKQMGLLELNDGSTTAGLKVVANYWKNMGIETKSLFIADGSGLSRFNAITAITLTDILVRLKQDSLCSKIFEQSLPLAGLEGTMKNYFTGSVLNGKARVKSGSMTRVRSLAGFMPTKNGRTVAFAIMVNNFSCTGSEMARKMERLMEDFYGKY